MFLRSLLLLLAVSPTSAQVRYSSSSYVRAVLAASPETAKVEEQFSAASARLKSDIAQTFLPSLSFSGTLSPAKLDQNSRFSFGSWRGAANDASFTPGLNWNLFNSFQDSLGLRNTRLARDIAKEDLEITLQSRALTAVRTFYDYLLKEKFLEVAHANQKAQEAQYRLTQERYKHGMKSLSDLLKTETDWRSSELEVESAEAERRLARFRFNVLLDRPEEAPFELIDDLVLESAEAPELDAGLARAMRLRPELIKDRLVRRRADTTYQLAVQNVLPALALNFDMTHPVSGSYGSRTDSFGFGTAAYGFTLSLALPSGFNFYSQVQNLKAARSTWRQSLHDTKALERSVREEVYRAQINLLRAMRSYQIAVRKEEISKQNYEIVSEQYSQQSADVIRLSQALVDYVNAQRERMRAYNDSSINRAEYRRAVGESLWQ